MARLKNIYMIKKRGQGEVVGAVLLLGLLIVGGIGAHKIISENRYVGDTSTKLYYDLKKCDIENLDKVNLISFKTLNEAEKDGFMPAKCSK